MKNPIPLIAGLVLALGLSGQVFGQGTPQSGGVASGADAVQQGQFTDADLQKFVSVQPALTEIRTEYSARLEGVTDKEQAAKLQHEAIEKMTDVVRGAGLDIPIYNEIAVAMQSDGALRDRIESMMN